MKAFSITTLIMTIAVCIALSARAQDVPAPKEGKRNYSPYPEKTFPNRVYFGDTHLHTSYSTDAGMVGNTLGPEEAYRFARGEEVVQSQVCVRSCSARSIFLSSPTTPRTLASRR